MSHAEILLDHEEHPIPLFDMTVILPVGFEAKDASEAGAANLLSDILENGTASLDRQAFLDKLADFGASYDFTVSNQYSYWKLSFPVVPGKDYHALAQILADNWAHPRFTDETFEIARTKLSAALTGGLDNDMALGITTARRWVNKKEFGGHPVFVDNIARMSLAQVKGVYERDFMGIPSLWAGLVGPKETSGIAEDILRTVFSKQGELKRGPYLKKLETIRPAKIDGAKASKQVIIVDKAGRNQTVTSVTAIRPESLGGAAELSFQFGNHILVDSGLGSIFGDEIRNKRGLAYSVGGVQPFYLGMPVLGFAANPVRPRTEEAFKVIAGLLQSSYETAHIFKDVPEELWKRQWQSFTYSKVLETSSPAGRLSERMSVVTGMLSPKLYQTPVEDWKVSRGEVEKLFSEHWRSSIVTLSFVGEAAELKPLVEKNFPGYAVKVIPYKETVRSAVYE
ncbi:MAG: insulinase family protein [Bdellovibrionales bacterium]|nr:insulinase family protein [Bdellovibrionales bacterium]